MLMDIVKTTSVAKPVDQYWKPIKNFQFLKEIMTARTITNSRLVDWAKLDNITVTLPIDLDDLTPWGLKQ